MNGVPSEWLCFGSFIGLTLLLLVWAGVIAPRLALRVFTELERRGWRAVAKDDPSMLDALESLRPFTPSEVIDETGRGPSARVSRALARDRDGRVQYLVQAQTSGPSKGGSGASYSFATVFLEPRPLALEGVVFVVARDTEVQLSGDTLEASQLRRVDYGFDQSFAKLYLVLAHAGAPPVHLPAALRDALVASAPQLVQGHGPSTRRLLHACLRFTPFGWGLLMPMLFARRNMESLLATADRVSGGLSGPSGHPMRPGMGVVPGGVG